MRNIEEITKEINTLKAERENIRGTVTEVYSRIVGYYRSVRNWNKGKREEYNYRTAFYQPEAVKVAESETTICHASIEPQKDLFASVKSSEYMYFYRETCPNCPPVREYLKGISLHGVSVNVDSREGMDEARKRGIMASPTVIILNENGEEVFRTSRVDELKASLEESDLTLAEEKVSLGV